MVVVGVLVVVEVVLLVVVVLVVGEVVVVVVLGVVVLGVAVLVVVVGVVVVVVVVAVVLAVVAQELHDLAQLIVIHSLVKHCPADAQPSHWSSRGCLLTQSPGMQNQN